jgi:hypothetical protein
MIAGILMNANTSNPSVDAYLNGRWKEQSSFFEAKAASNKKMFIWTRRLGFFAGIFTPIIIFVVVALSVDPAHKSALRQFVEACEALIEGTDVNYFVLMVDPLRRQDQ